MCYAMSLFKIQYLNLCNDCININYICILTRHLLFMGVPRKNNLQLYCIIEMKAITLQWINPTSKNYRFV